MAHRAQDYRSTRRTPRGPDGEVGEGGASHLLYGHFEYTYDPDVGRLTSFQSDGRAIGLCQLLGP